MQQHSAILRRPSHTRRLGPLGANLVPRQIDVRDGRVCLQRLGQGLETETEQGWRLHPGLYRSNRDHWNPENTWHLTVNLSDTELSKQCRKRQLLTASRYLTTLLAMKDEWWNYSTSKPSKLVTVTGCRKHNIMRCSSTQRFCGAHPTHQASTPSVPILFHCKAMFVTDEFIFSASAKAWKRRQSKAGVFIQGSNVQIVITEIRRTRDI